MAQSRKYSLTLFGATGFTGGLCADYLGQHLPKGTSWALAGRNPAKLERSGHGCKPLALPACPA